MHYEIKPTLREWAVYMNEKYDWCSSLRMPETLTPALIEIILRTAGLIRYKKEEV